MYDSALDLIHDAQNIVVIQAENPDGDSLATSLALEEILSDLGKNVSLFCEIDVPKYLRYISGWDRVENQFNFKADLAIIVDTASETLLQKTLQLPAVRHYLETHPVLVIDHHTTPSSLSFDHTALSEDAVSTGELIHRIARSAGWEINRQAAEHIMIATLSDTLGLTTQNVSPAVYTMMANLAGTGAHVSEIEERRREYMKKSQDILSYKGALLSRIDYLLDGKLALIHIPWEEIQQYSDQYNPSVLVLDEMRLVEGVEVAVAIKTYPDGKATGKIRSNKPVAETIAAYFGAGGHAYAAGFKVYEQYDTVVRELVDATDKALKADA